MAETPVVPMRLVKGHILHHKTYKNSDGTPQRWKIISIKRWKRKPFITLPNGNKFPNMVIGLKRGLYQYSKLSYWTVYNDFTFPETIELKSPRDMSNTIFWY